MIINIENEEQFVADLSQELYSEERKFCGEATWGYGYHFDSDEAAKIVLEFLKHYQQLPCRPDGGRDGSGTLM